MVSRPDQKYREFYEAQISECKAIIEAKAKQDISLETYLRMQEQLGKEPDEKILRRFDESRYPIELQFAYYLYGMLPTIFHGMGDYYAGKDLSSLGTLLRVFDVSNERSVVELLLYINQVDMDKVNKKMEQARQRERAKANKGKTVSGK